jgi:hypothetical protein
VVFGKELVKTQDVVFVSGGGDWEELVIRLLRLGGMLKSQYAKWLGFDAGEGATVRGGGHS